MQRRILAVVGALALTLPTSAAFAASPGDDPSSRFLEAGSAGQLDSTIDAAAADPDRQVTVVIEMEGDPVAVVEAEKGRDLTKSERATVKSSLKKKQDAIRGSIKGKGGKIQAQMQSAYNGIQATVPAGEVAALEALPGVVAVHSVVAQELDNAVSVPFLGVPEVWQSTGYTGESIKVAIIDTGIDYTHATFGGPGTVEAYEAAAATSDQEADPALFGPAAPRVKGGIDLVGDDYDAGGEGAALIPQPDPNPLDCHGHGTHVAGTTGGSGVLADGSTYPGPYDESTSGNDFLVGPGVAPEVELYGVRVFGCDGSTDVTVQAIDWAVDNGMDVINMSLGSPFGRSDDPSAVAASNAVGAGVVVVTSAGNSGHNPYLTGSPGAGDGVIAVAAVDSTESFPGAIVTTGGTDVEAINANGADLSAVGELEVVVVTDDPATTANEALGCAASDFTQAGITPGGGQLAVVTRGSCARVAKAIFGQQAGAEAVVMVNSDNTLPPYEGAITSNPDDGTPYVVTIPFLGVRASDGAAFTTGETATMVAAEIANPGFRGYASFTSSGPRSGDSAISPNVAAPGVAIASAGVGTGNGAAIMSGTSMAAPHVAGVAALVVQSHPDWTAPEVASAIVSTADPDKVAGQSNTLGGVGLVDTAQAVATTVTATGDAFRTESGWAREAGLSFGFEESTRGFAGVKTVTVRNDGDETVRFNVSTVATEESVEATVRVAPKSVTVRPGRTAKIAVTLRASASDVPGSLSGDQFSFSEISGDIVLTSDQATLRVPYLLVPRSNSDVTTNTKRLVSKRDQGLVTADIDLRNRRGALDATADVYTWGLSDKKDVARSFAKTGFDLRAAGVQSFAAGGDHLLVFAVNTYDRWSNGASNEFDVVIDNNGDGTPDWIVFSYDSGAVRAGSVDGVTEVFLQEISTGNLYASGFLAQAPTDSSSILLPVWAGDIGVAGAFDYTVESFSLTTDGSDAMPGWAAYDPTAPAVSNGQFATVPVRGSATVSVEVDTAAAAEQGTLGSMIVVPDNESGADEALLVKLR
ncbi:S8 family serine peptidase [Microbacterium sp. MC2]